MTAWLDLFFAAAAPLGFAFGRLRPGVTVLAYHDVHDADAFDAQMRWLAAETDVVALDDLLAGRLPPRATLVTFDDGHRSVLEAGLPVLRARSVPALLFVVAGLLDTALPFWWTEVEQRFARGETGPLRGMPLTAALRHLKQVPDDERREILSELGRGRAPVAEPQLRSTDLHTLQQAGVEIGNHTTSHPCLDRTREEVGRSEVQVAHERLTSALGRPPRAFAWPNGNVDARLTTTLAELGYRIGFAFDHRRHLTPTRDPWTVSRVRVDSRDTIDRFRSTVAGWHPRIHRVRVALRTNVSRAT